MHPAATSGVVVGTDGSTHTAAGADARNHSEDERVRPSEVVLTPAMLRRARSLMCPDSALLLVNTTPAALADTLPLLTHLTELFNDVRVRRKRRELLPGYNVVISASERAPN